MTTIAIVQATFPDLDDATRIGQALIDERFAACCNVLAPCLSVYRWNGATETAHEAIAQFKTLPERAEAAAARIVELHRYELPSVERWIAETDEAGYRWIADTMG